jgi:hypothetical protein
MAIAPTLPAVLAHASRDDPVTLPQVEGHWAGMVLGLASALLGVLAVRSDWAVRDALAWAALGGIAAGMLLHSLWKETRHGWRIDFRARRIEPVGQRGDPVVVSGEGWSVACAPGDRRSQVAIDLRHADRGRVVRLFVAVARRAGDQRQVDQLAAVLARRLGVPRSGPML